MIYFEPINHDYISIKPEDSHLKWTSVTTLLHKYVDPFDKEGVAEKCGKSPNGKWGSYTKEQIIKIWDDEAVRASSLGNWYHDQRENDVLSCGTMNMEGFDIPVVHNLYDNKKRKIAPSQKLKDGMYPELLLYLKSAGIAGQSDLVKIVNGAVYIVDYKTNKEIKERSYINWEGQSKMMKAPVAHMEDCHISHYTLQLSIYMYIILKHNPKLRAGGIVLYHALFKIVGENEYGYPIHERDNQGNFIVDKVKEINLPYAKREVMDILKDHKLNGN